MSSPDESQLKEQVRGYWNRQSCDTHAASSAKFSREYFEEIESYRYHDQAVIHAFAQFTRYHGRRVLEVGFGAGTDFIQWLRAGAKAAGIDLTQEGLDNLTHRIEVYGLPRPEEIRVADAENLPFESGTFDLGYSFGVLHHSPDTPRAVAELVRVIRPGGELKIMLYNRRSICALNAWVKGALLRGQPWRSVAWAVWNHVESVGTQAYTRGELTEILRRLPLTDVRVQTEMTSADTLASSAFAPLRAVYHLAIRLFAPSYPWQLAEYNVETRRAVAPSRGEVQFAGHPLGWFHCIRARKHP